MALRHLETATNHLIQRCKDSGNESNNISEYGGLSALQLSTLVDGITNATNCEWAEGSLKRTLEQRKQQNDHKKVSATTIFKNSQICISPNMLKLPTATASKRLIEAMIPNGEVKSESVAKMAIWALGNRDALNENCVLLPILGWINCVLHYQLCEPTWMENIYELFLQSLHINSVVSIMHSRVGVNTRDGPTIINTHLYFNI